MPWAHVLASWPNLIEHLCYDFRHLEVTAMRRFRGDRARMEMYLAETHDLTVAEAGEALDNWLTYTGARLRAQAAA
ncbi:hypothetical protein L0664_06060 [Octadecabacter sp. G9-8]|uniref:Uncharacterized protein n=1 Tax=Octadecabacter dasysiphoniae TaxID=2909341 RepID=A0ABS9CTQ7_9RHOB|nr:hypothetical protein [Octadecabacter dasysiphoniae]MCF2870623.1 hypothetical protein [Octadecabacter dasysiphoniae]